jgi:ATP-dependent Clp protease protease subunit
MKSWYSIKNKSDVLDISIHDEIGMWGVSAADFMADLKAHSEARVINLSIHSPGGSVLDGLAMYNSLKSHTAKVFGKVDGIAASAASFVLMAADNIAMPEDSFLMIHNAHGVAIGDADAMRETADVVEKLQDSIVNIYASRSGKDADEIRAMMKEETWMNASDALSHGFIDTITNPINVAAKIGAFKNYFKSMPVENDVNPDSIANERDFEKCLRDSGISKTLAMSLVSRAKDIFTGDPEDTGAELDLFSAKLRRFQI